MQQRSSNGGYTPAGRPWPGYSHTMALLCWTALLLQNTAVSSMCTRPTNEPGYWFGYAIENLWSNSSFSVSGLQCNAGYGSGIVMGSAAMLGVSYGGGVTATVC